MPACWYEHQSFVRRPAGAEGSRTSRLRDVVTGVLGHGLASRVSRHHGTAATVHRRPALRSRSRARRHENPSTSSFTKILLDDVASAATVALGHSEKLTTEWVTEMSGMDHDYAELLEALRRGRRGAHHERALDAVPRRAESLPSLQLEQRAVDPHPEARRDTRRGLQGLASPWSSGSGEGVGTADLRADEVPKGRRRPRARRSAKFADSSWCRYSTSVKPKGPTFPIS